jgi:hypothetical protein
MFRGAFVPNWLLRRKEVTPGAKLCYARLCQFSGENNKCHPRQETLAAELGISARSVGDYLRELRHHGLLESERPGLGRANRYFFLDHAWIYEGPPLRTASASDRQDIAGQERQSSSTPIREENPGRESIEGDTQATVSPVSPLPLSEEEAVKSAAFHDVPADFARAVFNHLEGVGWLDGSARPIRKWEPYIKNRWAREQSERAERAVRPRGKHRASTTSSLKTVRPEQFTGTVGKL